MVRMKWSNRINRLKTTTKPVEPGETRAPECKEGLPYAARTPVRLRRTERRCNGDTE